MDSLLFKIIFVPEGNNTVSNEQFIFDVQKAVENCDLSVESISYFQVRKNEDEDYPEIEELSLIIQGRAKTSYISKKEQYKNFCLKWKNRSKSLPCSYIVLFRNDYFSYAKKTHIHTFYNRISFGVLPHNGYFYEYKQLPQSQGQAVNFYHDSRYVVITYDDFEMKFAYENIHSVIININNFNELFFYLCNPPLIFRTERITPRRSAPYVLSHRNLDLNSAPLICQLFKLDNNNSQLDKDVWGRSNVLCLQLSDFHVAEKIIDGIHFHCSEKPIHFSNISSIYKTVPHDPVLDHMHFGCAYLITAILRRSFTVVAQASVDISYLMRKLDSFSRQHSDSLEKSLISVLAALDSGKILNFWHAIENQFNFYNNYKDEINFKKYVVPPKCLMIRRVMLTPTRQLLWPPEIMYGNRVLRNYDADYFLRVSFRDDNMSRMSFIAPMADEGVLDSCIKNPMTKGIRIGARHFKFLAWSNSQIRDHGVWMYAKDLKGRTVEDIREWMGDFSHIHNVPKYMARMGQCFSQTEDALSVPLDPEHVRTENDIESGFDRMNYKPYCFSDGVGRISTTLAGKVHAALGHDKLCSAFQIRYGGYKGMLTVDPTLKDVDIVFRKSMKKFDSPLNTRLEIAKTSAPVTLQLNKPFISLLNHLGVRHRTFLRLQENVLHTLTDMLFKEAEASQFLTAKAPNNLYKYEDLSEAGIYLTTEPFFKSLLLALHRHHIELIKSRANIGIDPDYGRNMLGVIDETGLLSYGEVFVQYTIDIWSGETTRKTTVLEGEVLVTKNPCMYPGDVRKFKAVNVPQLHHIVDCIVFPQRGDRPHPSEMAGSDLDGDEYAVLWFKDLIFHGSNRNAANFPAVNCPDVPVVTVKHMIDFLQLYIKNDQVGTIANAHLAHSDSYNPDHRMCLEIAKKFSIAVDFAKNGQSQQLSREERPQKFPDFMEKNHKDVYKSNRAIGKMYRVCKDFESENQETSFVYHDIKVDPDLVYNGWERYKDVAIKAKKKYNELFRSILVNYGIQHEAEALSGAFTNLHCRFQERKDRNEVEKVVIGCLKQLQKTMREELLEEFANAGDISATEEKIFQKASACYCVTYSDPKAKFLSFPWILSSHLYNIKVRKTLANQLPFSPVIQELDTKILECESKYLLPHYNETRIWNDYDFVCDPKIVKFALRTLILWAQEQHIVESPTHTKGLMFESRFIQLFLHIAHVSGYVSKRGFDIDTSREVFSSGHLCLEFLKYCSSFRFYNPEEMKELVPFEVFQYNKLAKRAIVSYHKCALHGKFENLYFDERIEEMITMKAIYINSKIFPSSPVSDDSLVKAEDALKKYSKVEDVSLREIRQTRKISVIARGSEMAIKDLKSILRKKDVVLGELFRTGVMLD